MKKIIIIILIAVCLILASLGITIALIRGRDTYNTPNSCTGVWWWDDDLDIEPYLSFASDNDINEIYYCTSKFNEKTSNFIKHANSQNIKVFWLAGEYQWLDNEAKLIDQIEDYIEYQQSFPSTQFNGIHLDIEPHQNPNFDDNRYQLIYNLIDLANKLNTLYPDITFDYDLPFWLHDEINYNTISKPAYEFMIDIANRVFVMSYRDTYNAILDVAEEEISYAKNANKQLVLCVETYSTEGDKVSFYEEGKQVLIEEIKKLKAEIPNNFGIAIHQIKTWYELKE